MRVMFCKETVSYVARLAQDDKIGQALLEQMLSPRRDEESKFPNLKLFSDLKSPRAHRPPLIGFARITQSCRGKANQHIPVCTLSALIDSYRSQKKSDEDADVDSDERQLHGSSSFIHISKNKKERNKHKQQFSFNPNHTESIIG